MGRDEFEQSGRDVDAAREPHRGATDSAQRELREARAAAHGAMAAAHQAMHAAIDQADTELHAGQREHDAATERVCREIQALRKGHKDQARQDQGRQDQGRDGQGRNDQGRWSGWWDPFFRVRPSSPPRAPHGPRHGGGEPAPVERGAEAPIE